MTTKVAVDTLQAAVDTLKHAGGKDNSWIMHHIVDGREVDFMPFGTLHIPQFPTLFGIDITPTKHVLFMWLAALLVILTFVFVARSYKKSRIPKRFANFFEVFIVFVRDEIARDTIGKGYEKFVPYLLSLFFFVLFGNFLGMIPWSYAFTSNIAATGGLAIISFFAILFGGIKENSFFGYFKGMLPHGVPKVFLPLLAMVEFLGLFTKPFALCIRLFANMIAGHTVIFTLFGLIFFMGTALVGIIAVPFALFIYLLEILVALIQAYIFTVLTSLFIGMAMHQEH